MRRLVAVEILVTLVVNGFIILLVFQDLHRLIAQQELELGASDFARVRGRYPSGAGGSVLLDECQISTVSAAILAAP